MTDTLDKITDTKPDEEFTVSAGREPRIYTAGVKIWEFEPNKFHLEGYWDIPGCVEGLGTPVTIEAVPEVAGKFPQSVMKEAQNFLFLGLDIMREQGLKVTKAETKAVYDMCP
jgi:hypothetical protein